MEQADEAIRELSDGRVAGRGSGDPLYATRGNRTHVRRGALFEVSLLTEASAQNFAPHCRSQTIARYDDALLLGRRRAARVAAGEADQPACVLATTAGRPTS